MYDLGITQLKRQDYKWSGKKQSSVYILYLEEIQQGFAKKYGGAVPEGLGDWVTTEDALWMESQQLIEASARHQFIGD